MATQNTIQMPSRSKPLRPSRQQLLFGFDMHRDAEANNTNRSYFIGTPYPPCSKSVAELSPINIDDLELESHHRGRVLILRCIEEPIRSAAIQTIIEDSKGEAERLSLYNVPLAFQAEDVLPEDSVFALKEPYYEQTDQGSCIRVDHPSDLVALYPSHELLPESLRPSDKKSALQWKDDGNAAYGSNKYLLALRAYNNAIYATADSISSEDVSLKRLILRNRTIAHLYLGHFEPALEDAQAAVIPQDECVGAADAKRNITAYYRAGRAAYELQNYSKAERLFHKALQFSPKDTDSLKEQHKIKDRQNEASGEYDFVVMSKSVSKKHNRLDGAEFISQTEVRPAGEGRGRGLFATKDLEAGELIMCEKALCVSFESDPGASASYAILNSKTQRRATGTTASLLFQLIEKLSYNPQIAERFFDLQDDNYAPRTPLKPVDGVVPVDAFRTLAILDHNCYGCPTVRSSSNAAQAQLAGSTGYPSSGVWIHASYINHACNGNAMRSFIGDMMIVRATRNIKQGDEICMPYRLPHPDHTVTQEELLKIWGFKCDCSLCRAEAATPGKEKKQRQELAGKAAEFVAKSKLQNGVKPDKMTIEQAIRLYERLEKTYDSKKFDGMPRPGLLSLGIWLCQAYSSNDNHAKSLEISLRLLRDLGFILQIEKDELSVGRRQCLLEPRSVEASVYAAKAYKASGNTVASGKMTELARSLYEILNGELRGFEDRYGL